MTIRFAWRSSLLDDDFPAAAFEQLRNAVELATPFNRLAWLRGAEQALGAGQRLRVLLGWHGERLVLCLPLLHGRERKAGLPLQVVRHLGFPSATAWRCWWPRTRCRPCPGHWRKSAASCPMPCCN